jgi:N-methylhydantoinase B
MKQPQPADPRIAPKRIDPVLIEVMRHELIALSEEMNMTMRQTTRSIIAREASELSAALLSPQGEVLGQAMFYGLGYFTAVMPYLLEKFGGKFRPGDVYATNDPYGGASHLPDIVVVMPMFWNSELCGFCAVVEHHTDIGGRYAGGMGGGSTDMFHEGLRLPAIRFYRDGQPEEAVRQIIAANVRTPDDVLGDLDAAVAACRRGERGFVALLEKHGREAVESCYRQLHANAENAVREMLRRIPRGSYRAEDLFDDGEGIQCKLALNLIAGDGEVTLDFTGTGPQVPRAYNIPPDMLQHILAGYFMYMLGSADVPINSGLFAPIKTVIPKGCALNPEFPAAVGCRGTLIWPVVDLFYQAIGQAIPMPAANVPGSSMTYLADGRTGGGSMFPDLYASGWGARPDKDGVEGAMPLVMSQFMSTPTEAFEREVPLMLEGCGFVPDTGGAGKFRGALSLYRSWRFLADGQVLLRTIRQGSLPFGRSGGSDGTPNRLYLISNGDGGKIRELPRVMVNDFRVRKGDVLVHVQHGAGGYGDPLERDPQKVLEDVLDEKITAAYAEREYGVAIDARAERVDEAKTRSLRSARRSPDRARVATS